jgi:hypothetical protein
MLMDDSCDILYITMLLDPRFNKLVLDHELNDEAENISAAHERSHLVGSIGEPGVRNLTLITSRPLNPVYSLAGP